MATLDIIEAKPLIKSLLSNGTPFMLSGAPGVGKSELVWQCFAEAGFEGYEENVSSMESVDARGNPFIVDGDVKWARPQMFRELHAIADRGGKPALFLDEFNHGDPSVMKPFYRFLLKGEIGPHKAPKGTRVALAGNRLIDQSHAQRMGRALDNRLAHIEIKFSVDAWKLWANSLGQVSPLLVAFAEFRGRSGADQNNLGIFDAPVPQDARAFVTARSFTECNKYVHESRAIRHLAFAALVGETVAGEMVAFMDTIGRFPSPDDIIADPDAAPVPSLSEPGLVYAVAAALSRKADRRNFAPVIRYLDRLPTRDFCVMGVVDAVKRDATLKETVAFTSWANRYQGVVL